MSNLYTEIILFYYKHPKNKGTIENPTFEFSENNPVCGDKLQIQVLLDNKDNIVDIKWNGVGCAISQASASILTSLVKLQKMSLDDLRNITKDDLLEQLGIELSPNRLKCALLSLNTLKSGVITFIGMRGSDSILLKNENKENEQ